MKARRLLYLIIQAVWIKPYFVWKLKGCDVTSELTPANIEEDIEEIEVEDIEEVETQNHWRALVEGKGLQ